MNPYLFIKSVNTNHIIGKAVQDYANYHFRTGFCYGMTFGIIICTASILISGKKFL